MKKWTVETLVSQLNVQVRDAIGADFIADPESYVLDWPLRQVIEEVKEAAFREKMQQIAGQTRIVVTDNGEVGIDEEG